MSELDKDFKVVGGVIDDQKISAAAQGNEERRKRSLQEGKAGIQQGVDRVQNGEMYSAGVRDNATAEAMARDAAMINRMLGRSGSEANGPEMGL